MRFLVTLLALSSLAACTDKSAETEKQLALVEKFGTLGEVCEASRKVANAYLEENDEWRYQVAQNNSAISCMKADQIGASQAARDDVRMRASADADAMEASAEAAAGLGGSGTIDADVLESER
jgi:hypothetical protein